ncbi:unnamed protein product, partial [Didymodactylos carnosus]
AKQLIKGEPNVSYICSRYYRAPELIFGAIDYTCYIDVWSSGCVLAELLLGQPIFPGESGVDQLVEIIKVLGTPSREQIRQMNPNYQEFRFPQIKAHPWHKVFRNRTPPMAIDVVCRLLDYTPATRLTPLEACAHSFFDELRDPETRLPNGLLPPLFNFSQQELNITPSLNNRLIPAHMQSSTPTVSVGTASNNDKSSSQQQSTSVRLNNSPPTVGGSNSSQIQESAVALSSTTAVSVPSSNVHGSSTNIPATTLANNGGNPTSTNAILTSSTTDQTEAMNSSEDVPIEKEDHRA